MKTQRFICDNKSTILAGAWVAALAMSLLAASTAEGVTRVWIGPSSGGEFNDADNWSGSPPGFPDAADAAIWNAAEPTVNVDGTITFSADAFTTAVQVRQTAGTLTFDVGPHKWTTSGNFFIGLGVNEGSTVEHISGSIESSTILIGNNAAASDNTLTLSGAGTHWHTTIAGGGPRVGSSGGDNATLIVQDGAQITTAGQAIMGVTGANDGLFRITGQASSVAVGTFMTIGHSVSAAKPTSSNHRLEVLDGASLIATHIILGLAPAATNNSVLVSGNGSTIQFLTGATTDVGRAGSNSTLRIENGGAVTGGGRFLLARETSSTGNQLIIDNGSLTGTDIEVRSGHVAITAGAVDLRQFFSATEQMWMGGRIVAASGAASTIAFNSGSLAAVGADIDNGLAFTVGDGGASTATYRMKEDVDGNRGAHTFANGLVLNSNAVLTGNGDIVANVSGASGAQVAVGDSIGLINVTGDWDNTGLQILLEIGDLTGGIAAGESHDLLDISGTFTHGGSVLVDLSNLQAASAAELQLIGWGNSAGAAGDTAVSFLGGTATYEIRPEGLFVDVVPSDPLLPGDANRDGRVDGEDFLIWQASFGIQEGATWDDGDFNGDGRVDGEDFLIWQAHFGSVASSAAVIPEPAALSLLGLTGLLLRRRRA